LDFISEVLAIFHNLPEHLALWTTQMGPWIYVALFAVIFAETGLIVMPILPGDSLLFALGALTAVTNGNGQPALDFRILAISLIIAANLGDALNYTVGRWLGLKLFKNPDSKIFNPAHLARTHAFYERHGGKAIILARFAPIIRTYAPFVAGVGRMQIRRFAAFSVAGGAMWILTFLSAGHFFGNIPEVKSRFQYVIIAIIVISLLPAAIEVLRARRAKDSSAANELDNFKTGSQKQERRS
jgi:membrane-associated protein